MFVPGTPLGPVNFAFGGMCIYRKQILEGLEYDIESEDCEHVAFHRAIGERGGRIFMNPSLVVKYSHYEDND